MADYAIVPHPRYAYCRRAIPSTQEKTMDNKLNTKVDVFTNETPTGTKWLYGTVAFTNNENLYHWTVEPEYTECKLVRDIDKRCFKMPEEEQLVLDYLKETGVLNELGLVE